MPRNDHRAPATSDVPPNPPRGDVSNWGGPKVALLALVALAVALRVVGLRHGLPYAHLLDPGEHDVVPRAWRLVHGGGADPHWYRYPSLLLYALAPVQAWQGAPSYLAARIEIVVLALGAVAAAWWLARRTYGNAVSAAVAAAFVAVATAHVAYAHAALPDVPLTLGVGVALALAAGGRVELAAVAAGLAAGFDYAGLILVVPLAVAAWRRWWRLTASVALMLGCFAATSPFLFAHPGRAWSDATSGRHDGIRSERGHAALVAVADRLWHSLGPALLVALLGLLVALALRRRAELVLGSFVLAYSVALVAAGAHSARSILPLLPPLAALAGRFRSLAPVTLLLLVVPLTWSIRDDRQLVHSPKPRSAVYHLAGRERARGDFAGSARARRERVRG